MAPESTEQNAAQATVASGQKITVTKPEAGAAVEVMSSPGGQLDLGFDPSTSNVTRDGNSLVFDVDGGGRVTVTDFFRVGDQPLPDLRLPDGTVVASNDFFQGSDLDMTTAAGPAASAAPGSGGTNYADDSGNLIGGVDKYGMLGTDYWGRNTEVTIEQRGLPGPSGDFGFTVTTADPSIPAMFTSMAYEDGRPSQHLYGDNASLYAARINMTINPGPATTVGNICFFNVPEGAQLFIGDPANGGRAVTPDATGRYYFTEDDFSDLNGVYIIPPANSDADFTMDVLVEMTGGNGVTQEFGGVCEVIVDAVADLPLNVSADLEADKDHYMSQSSATDREHVDQNQDGLLTSTHKVEAKAEEGMVEVRITVNATFTDLDGSEGHYALVQVVDGLVLPNGVSYETYTAQDGTQYYMVRVTPNPDGTVSETLTFYTKSSSSDTSFPVKTGALAREENISGGELNYQNNTSEVILHDTPEMVTVDTISSFLTLNVGWVSESDNDAKHLASGNPADYDYKNGAPAQGDNAGGGTESNGAPITLSLKPNGQTDPNVTSSADTFSKVTINITDGEGAPGYLVVNEGDFPTGTQFQYSYDAQGNPTSVTIDYSNVAQADRTDDISTGVWFKPYGDSNDSSDAHITVDVIVGNESGASAKFETESDVVVDAVADRAVLGNADVEYNSDQYGTQTAAKPGEGVNVKMDVRFPDTSTNSDGALNEQHFILVKALPNGAGGKADVNSITVSYNGQTLVYTNDGSGTFTCSEPTAPALTVDNGYYQIEVPGDVADVTVTVNVDGAAGANNSNAKYEIEVGGKSVALDPDLSYDGDNDKAINTEKVGFDVAPNNSGTDAVEAKDTSESKDGTWDGVNPNAHNPNGTWGVGASTTDGIKAGDQFKTVAPRSDGMGNFSFTVDQNGDSSKEKLHSVEFTVDQDLSAAGSGNLSIVLANGTLVTLTVDGQASGNASVSGVGTFSYTTDSVSGTTTVTFTPELGGSGVSAFPENVTFKYVGGKMDDTDITITDYKVTTINEDSHEVSAPITPNGGDDLTVVVDSVANGVSGLNNATIHDSRNDGTGTDYDNLARGTDFTINTSVTFNDTDGSESFFLMIAAKDFAATTTQNKLTGGKIYAKDAQGNYINDTNGNPIVLADLADPSTYTTVTINGVVYIMVNVDSTMLVNGNTLNVEINATTPSVTSNAHVTFTPEIGGGTLEDARVDNNDTRTDDAETFNENNFSFSTKPTNPIVVDRVGSGSLKVEVGKAYENATPEAHVGQERDSDALQNGSGSIADAGDRTTQVVDTPSEVKAGSAHVSIEYVASKWSEPGQVVGDEFVRDVIIRFPEQAPNGLPNGNMMYKDTLIPVPTDGSTWTDTIDGDTVTCWVENGQVYVKIEGYDNSDASGGHNLYFVPGENYSSSDVTIDYSVIVEDKSSGDEKVYTTDRNDPNMREGFENNWNDLTNVGKETVVIDAVAQKPEFDDITVNNGSESIAGSGVDAGAALDKDSDGKFDKVIPGGTATITINADFQGDVSDGSEDHYLFVKMQPGWDLNFDASGKVILTINGVEVSCNYSIQQTTRLSADGSKEMYWRIELDDSNAPLKGYGNDVISFDVKTPANAGVTETLDVGLGSHEKTSAQDGEYRDQNRPLPDDNNISFTPGQVEVEFSKAGGGSIGHQNGYYERGQTWANEGNVLENAAISINVTLANPYDATGNPTGDYVTKVEFTPDENDADLGSMFVFENVSDYQSYLNAYNAYKNEVESGNTAATPPKVTDFGAKPLSQYDPDGDGTAELPVNDGKFEGQVVFVPNKDTGHYGDGDYNFDYDITVRDPESGDEGHIAGSSTIVGDAVAQKPVDIGHEGQLSDEHGKESKVTVSATFTDVDGSTDHYVLVEVKPNWTIQYMDKATGNTVTLGIADTIQGPSGTLYYKVPVQDWDTATNNVAKGSTEVIFTSPPNHPNLDSSAGEFKTGGYSHETDPLLAGNGTYVEDGNTEDRGRELTYHNNHAITEQGSIEVDLEGGHDPGGHWHVSITGGLYEDNNMNGHLQGWAGDVGADYGQLNLGSAPGADYVTITVPKDSSGNPLLMLRDENNNPLTPNYDGTYTINKVNGTFPPVKVGVTEHYTDKDGDLQVGYEFEGGNHSGTATAIVDAVADYTEIDATTSASKDDTNQGWIAGDNDDKTSKFTVSVEFQDNDGSENHYILVEQIPGWPVQKGVVDVVTVDGKSYYRLNPDALEKDTNGDYIVEVKFDKGNASVHGDHMPDIDNASGVWTGKLQVGAMVQEKNTGTSSNLELTIDNNTSVSFVEEPVEVYYSPVNSAVSVSFATSQVTEGEWDLNNGIVVNVNFSGSAVNHDSLEGLTLTYDDSLGTLYGPNGNKIDPNTDLVAAGIVDKQGNVLGGELKYVPNDHNYVDPNLSWSTVIKDQLSGDTGTPGGSTTLVIDALADHSDNTITKTTDAVDGSGTAYEAVKPGETTTIKVSTDFEDTTNNTEEHWVVLSQQQDFTLDKIIIDGVEYHGEVMTKFDSNGRAYWAVKVDYDKQNVDVEFVVKAPQTTTDTSSPKFSAGTITVETTRDGETNLVNNWTEDIDHNIVIEVGTVDTTGISLTRGDLEGDYDQLLFTISGGSNDVIGSIEFTNLQGGTIYEKLGDGSFVPVNGPLDGAKAAAGAYYYDKSGPGSENAVNLGYTATIVDTKSGATGTINGSNSITPRNTAEGSEMTDGSIQIDAVAVSGDPHKATVTAQVNAKFVDVDESENHYVIFTLPEGATITSLNNGAYTAVAMSTSMANQLGLGAGTHYYVLFAKNTNADVSLNVEFTVDHTFDAANGITVHTATQETSRTGTYNVSSDTTEITVDMQHVGELNAAPVVADNVSADMSDLVWSAAGASGQVDPDTLFSDTDGDGVVISGVEGLEDLVRPADGHTVVEGEHGYLTIDEQGGYTYTPKGGTHAAGSEDTFTLYGRDGYGGNTHDNDDGSSLVFTYDAKTIAGTDGQDTLAATTDDEVFFGGAEADSFVWTADSMSQGTDTIVGFEVGTDKIDFSDIMDGFAEPDLESLINEGTMFITSRDGETELEAKFTSEGDLLLTLKSEGVEQGVLVQADDASSFNLTEFNQANAEEALALLQNILKTTTE